jgi:hypothetical protein
MLFFKVGIVIKNKMKRMTKIFVGIILLTLISIPIFIMTIPDLRSPMYSILILFFGLVALAIVISKESGLKNWVFEVTKKDLEEQEKFTKTLKDFYEQNKESKNFYIDLCEILKPLMDNEDLSISAEVSINKEKIEIEYKGFNYVIER